MKTLARRQLARAALSLAPLGGLSFPSAAAEDRVDIALTNMNPGPLPAEFTATRTGEGAEADWYVAADGTVPGGRVLTQRNDDRTDHRFPLAIYNAVSARDVDVSVRFKAIAGREDRAGGVAVRLQDAGNYYGVRANALEDNVNFYRVVNGARTEIKGARTKVASEVWHTLGLRAERDTFTILFNGTVLYTATDRTFMGDGKIALWTKADSITSFDALSIRRIR